MIERTLLKDLKEWMKRPNRKPLVLRGARQVGKTTLINEFARSFDSYIYLDLEIKQQQQIFSKSKNFNELLENIFFISGTEKNTGKTLIFIDEIQNSPEAIQYLRYFFEIAKNLFVIAAGSLLESTFNRNISFPVGRVEFLALRPCSFMEYLYALKNDKAVDIIKTYSKISEPIHNELISLFKHYTLIGGMPKVVAQYATTKDTVSLNRIYQSLLMGFTDDVEKYALNKSEVQYIRHILKNGFAYTGQRIKFERFGGSDYRSREMGEAFRTLEKTMLMELIYPVSSAKLPIQPNFRKSPRLQWVDTGLVNYAAGIQHEIYNAEQISDAWNGTIAEHIVGQEMFASVTDVISKKHFWTREEKNSSAEIDYIYPFQGLVIPIEVKSGDTGKLRSLHLFMDACKHKTAARIWQGRYHVDNLKTKNGKSFKLINVPFYLISQLDSILSKNIN